MIVNISRKYQDVALDVSGALNVIAATQRDSGEIPWSADGKTDPWDHVEAAMGLAIGGRLARARKAYEWLERIQLADGSFYASYRNGLPEDRTRDTNMSTYIAVGVWHYYLISGDIAFLRRMWPTVSAAIDFALGLQAPSGEIYWAISPAGDIDRMALLTGCSSIFMSLKCALAAARLLDYPRPDWQSALVRLAEAIRNRPALFNMTKARFAMDWFYPVLCGAVRGEAAVKRIDRLWKKFVVEDLGVRCVSDQPWVTIAETAELVIALSAMGNSSLSKIVFSWISAHTFDDGSFFCGFTFPNRVVWPEEKITWTNAVALMAADALYHLTPASRLFCHRAEADSGWLQKVF